MPLLPTRRYQVQINGFYQIFKEIHHQLTDDSKYKKENVSNSFYEASKIQVSKLDKNKKIKPQNNLTQIQLSTLYVFFNAELEISMQDQNFLQENSRKLRDTKGTFHAKMSTIKDRNGMDLTEADDIKKRWQEYTEELYKGDLHDPDNHNGVITHLESDILE